MWVERLGGMATLFGQALTRAVRPGLSWRREFYIQSIFTFRASVLAAAIVLLCFGFSTQGIQGGVVLAALGAADRDASFTALVVLREGAVFLTATVVAGTVGTAWVAEFGARKIREELDALRMLSVDPIRNMVVPRIAALALGLPVLNMFAFLAGTLGAYFAVTLFYGVTTGAFIPLALSNTSYVDLIAGAVKISLLGVIIAVICCYKGLNVTGGPQGVGRAVNEAVVACVVAIFFVNLIFTQILLAAFPDISAYR